MMPRSLITRLVVAYCLLLAVLGGLFITFTMMSFRHYLRESSVSNLSDRAQEIWNVDQGLWDDPTRLAQTISGRFVPETADRFIRIRIDGRVVYRSNTPEGRAFRPDQVPLVSPGTQPKVQLLGDLLLYTRLFHTTDGRPVVIDSGRSYTFARQAEERLTYLVFLELPALLIVAAFAGYILMRRALAPVESMINAAEDYSFHDAHKRIPLAGDDPHFEALALALNRMLGRLENAYTNVSRFSIDAAHEFRTPITIMRGELELVMSQSRLSPEITRALSNSLEEMTRLSAMVDGLLTVSRMESLGDKAVSSTVNLAAVARETLDQMTLLAEEKRLTLEAFTPGDVLVHGDRDRLKQILVNLIDNAIKYTPEGGDVSVAVGTAGDRAYIEVRDTGIGIDEDDRDRVFDRFFRVMPDRGEHGTGLGLAIVRSICQAHGGTVSLQSGPGEGSCFRVELPVASRPAGEVTT
jgi:heavy metal sensor kinase